MDNDYGESKLKEQIKKQKFMKGMKMLLNVIFVVILILIEVLETVFIYKSTKHTFEYVFTIFSIVQILAIIYLLYRHDSAAYKLSWALFILLFPLAGIILFILTGNSKLNEQDIDKLKKIDEQTAYLLEKNEDTQNEIAKLNKTRYNQIKYINNTTEYSVYKNEGLEFFKQGDEFFEKLKVDLSNAKKYILIEFYILSDGKIWSEICEILKKKSAEDVKIHIICDSLGSLNTKPKNFVKEMKDAGIDVYIFNSFSGSISDYINHRNHRKIVSIDGAIAYNGGINLSDEFACLVKKYGHVKDVGVRIIGKPAWNYTMMILKMMQSMMDEHINFNWYKQVRDESLENVKKQNKNSSNSGYILGYVDGPNNMKNAAEASYLQMINNAKDYVYLTSPYLALNEAMLFSLLNSARSGVDVRIILPHIFDHKISQIVARSSYETLLEAGVKVYEYNPGFIHQKSIISDDEVSIIGSINIDFRSFYTNFECATLMYMTGIEKLVKEDFLETLKECSEINLNEWKKRSITKKACETVLAAFSPML